MPVRKMTMTFPSRPWTVYEVEGDITVASIAEAVDGEVGASMTFQPVGPLRVYAIPLVKVEAVFAGARGTRLALVCGHAKQSPRGRRPARARCASCRQLVAQKAIPEEAPTAEPCGHQGCKLRPGHIPGHTDR